MMSTHPAHSPWTLISTSVGGSQNREGTIHPGEDSRENHAPKVAATPGQGRIQRQLHPELPPLGLGHPCPWRASKGGWLHPAAHGRAHGDRVGTGRGPESCSFRCWEPLSSTLLRPRDLRLFCCAQPRISSAARRMGRRVWLPPNQSRDSAPAEQRPGGSLHRLPWPPAHRTQAATRPSQTRKVQAGSSFPGLGRPGSTLQTTSSRPPCLALSLTVGQETQVTP